MSLLTQLLARARGTASPHTPVVRPLVEARPWGPTAIEPEAPPEIEADVTTPPTAPLSTSPPSPKPASDAAVRTESVERRMTEVAPPDPIVGTPASPRAEPRETLPRRSSVDPHAATPATPIVAPPVHVEIVRQREVVDRVQRIREVEIRGAEPPTAPQPPAPVREVRSRIVHEPVGRIPSPEPAPTAEEPRVISAPERPMVVPAAASRAIDRRPPPPSSRQGERQRRTPPAPAPVQVTIGRVVVSVAAPPSDQPRRSAAPTPTSAETLEDYLASRNRGGR